MRPTLPVRALLLPSLLLLVACGGRDETPDPEVDATAAPEAQAPAAGPSVSIVEPAEGAEVAGPDVTVRLEISGMTIRPAGEVVAGTGHHHLYLDADLTEASAPVPTVPGSIIHMGDGSTAYTFEGVAPGEHRLIAVVADGIHMPLQPWVVDTVTFTVR